MEETRQRDNWGSAFRQAVSNGRGFAVTVLLVDMPFIAFWTDGLAQVFFLIVGLVALVALFPRSPLIPAIVQWMPKLPVKGDGSTP